MKELGIGIIGMGFMGRAHSSAWARLNQFFDTGVEIRLRAVCARDRERGEAFARKWGYESVETDWRALIARPDIDVVCILTPTYLHKEMALAAIGAGKHVFCEKPCALTSPDCREMAEAAEKAGVVTYLNHNYRRVPAVALARQLIDEGRIGTIRHFCAEYLQEWILDPDFPVTWQLRAETAGGGPLYDLGSHSVDLARYLVGEVSAVSARLQNVIAERPEAGKDAAVFSAGTSSKGNRKVPVTVEDAAFLLLDFENGACGSLDTSRVAAGRKNYNTFEVYGSRGSLRFNMERMNELEYYDAEEKGTQGFRSILVTEADHPYAGAWWPQGHIIGYEHTFVHACRDFVEAVKTGAPVSPDFRDGEKIIRVLEAAQRSDREGRRIRMEEMP